MNDCFVKNINIKKVRHLENINIDMGDEKKHLILTGKNGCGKTSVVENLDKYFRMSCNKLNNSENFFKFADKSHTPEIEKLLFDNFYLQFNVDNIFEMIKKDNSDFIYAYFPALRINKTNFVNGIDKLNFSKDVGSKLNDKFLQYIVNLKAEKSFARDDNEMDTVERIDIWFENFEKILKDIFNDDTLYLVFDRKEYDFKIHRSNREPFDFNSLSSGYSAIIDIISEIILKIEITNSKNFDCQGIVIIDELETHLHVELQRNILSLLTTFFPNIQFIITTHSPFVLSTLSDAIIYDLERKELVEGERLVNASYSQIVKNYFQVDSEFSRVLELDIKKYEDLIELFEKDELNIEQEQELLDLDIKLDKISPMLSDEIYLKFKELKDRITDDDQDK